MKNFLQIAGGVLAVVTLFITLASMDFIFAAFKKPIDVYENDLTKVPRYIGVESDVDLLLDCFCSETQKSTSNGRTSIKGTYNYYSLPVFVGEDVYYVALRVNAKESSAYEDVVDSTYAYLMMETDTLTKSVHYTGAMGKMDDDVYEYMVDYFEEMEWYDTDEELKAHVLPLQLKQADEDFNRVPYIILVALLAVGLIMFLSGCLMKTEKLPPVSDAELGAQIETVSVSNKIMLKKTLVRLICCVLLAVAGGYNLASQSIFMGITLAAAAAIIIGWPFFRHHNDKVILYQNGMEVSGERVLYANALPANFRHVTSNYFFHSQYMDTRLKTFDISYFEGVQSALQRWLDREV